MTILDSGRKNRSELGGWIYSVFLSVESFIGTYRGQKLIAAVVNIGGFFFAILLRLFIVPVLYETLARLGGKSHE